MAGKTRELKTRMKAVGNIQRITKTMQMIATARFQAMQKRATSAQAYSRKIAEVVADVAAAAGADEQFSHPLLTPPEPATGRQLLLVISSNRGLCGGYNANVLRMALSFLRTTADATGRDKIDLEVVGKKGRGYFKFNGIDPDVYHEQFGDSPEFEDVRRLAESYMTRFAERRYDAVQVCYMGFESMSKQSPRIEKLLPMQPPKAKEGDGGPSVAYDFSPPAEQLLGELLPITLKTRLYQCFNEAVVSEQLARMVAMKSATDSAGKMKKNLGRQYNRARQTAITTELTEIISGAMALE